MSFMRAWRSRLDAGVDPEFLVTIVVGHPLRGWDFKRHPSHLNGSICATSYYDSFDTNHATFFPTIINEMEVTTGIDPLKRSLEEIAVDIELSSDAEVPIDILDTAGTTMLWGQVDLWMPGMTLEQAIPLAIGRITEGKYDRRTGKTTMHLADGDSVREVKYPPGDMMLDRDSFSQIPVTVEGRYPRTVIMGRFPYPILCPQVSADPRLYYVCDHPLAQAPVSVEVNGTPTTQPYRILTVLREGPRQSALENEPYITLIEFSSAVDTTLPFITCSGGEGLRLPAHPALVLLEQYGQYRVERGSRDLLLSSDIDSSILVNASDNVLTIVKDRILRQTPYIGGFRQGEFVVQGLDAIPFSMPLEVGINLFDSDDAEGGQTDLESVYNAIEITYQRNIFSQSLIDVSRQVYALDSRSATGTLATKLRQSEYLYGRRFLRIDFPDVIANDLSVPAVIPKVAEQMLNLSAFQRQKYTYPCDIDLALTLPFNAVTTLTDPTRALDARAVRFISRTIRRNKVTTTFLSEDT